MYHHEKFKFIPRDHLTANRVYTITTVNHHPPLPRRSVAVWGFSPSKLRQLVLFADESRRLSLDLATFKVTTRFARQPPYRRFPIILPGHIGGKILASLFKHCTHCENLKRINDFSRTRYSIEIILK